MAWIIGLANDAEIKKLIDAEVEVSELTDAQMAALFGENWNEEPTRDKWVMANIDCNVTDLIFGEEQPATHITPLA